MKRLGKNLAMLLICAAMVIGLLLGMSLTALADKYVASVTPSGGTTTNYTDFATALSNWTEGSTLKLLDDVSYDQQIEVKNSKTLELNGCVFTIASSSFPHIKVDNSTLTIKDSGTKGKLTTAGRQRLVGIYNKGCLEINGGILESTSDADWTLIFVDNNSSVTLNDGVLRSKASNAVFLQEGTLNLIGGTINCESASNNMSTSSAVVPPYINGYIFVVNWTGTEIHTKAGYAFYTGGSEANCTLNISGKPKDSSKGVYLRKNVFITVTGELQNSSPIGITLESNSGVFTNSVNTTYNDASKFKSNDASYAVGKNAEGQLFLGTAISSVSVTDITAPVANEALDTAASTSTSNVTLSTVTWSPTTTPAAYATEYTATVTATAETGYAFPDNPEVTVNGKPASKVTKNSDGTLQIEYNFPRTKQLVTITAKDGEVPYATEGISIPVEGMFTIPDGAGAATYSVTNGTGEGTYNAKNGKLSISKCGTFNVSVSTAATETHLAAQSEARLTVNKAAPTVTAPVAKTLFYNEQLQELVTAGTTTGGTMYYAVTTENKAPADNLYTTAIPTGSEAKDYYVWYKTVGNEYFTDTEPASVKTGISPKSITGATVTLDKTQLIWTGTEQSVSVTGVVIDGMKLTADDYTVDGTSGADLGAYTVTVKGKGNFCDTATADWKIVEKAMVVNAENVNMVYDGQPHGITVTVTEPATGATVKYGITVGTYTLDASPTLTDAGTLTVYYLVTAENYTDYTGTAIVTVTKTDGAIVTQPTAVPNLAYNGTPLALVSAGIATSTMEYALGTDEVTPPTSGWSTEIPVAANAGIYYVWIRAAGDADHNASAPVCVVVDIAKVDPVMVTVPAAASNLVWTGEPIPLITVGTVTGGEILYAIGSYTKSASVAPTTGWSKEIPTATDAGTYEVWYKVVGDENHLDTEPVCLTVTVAAAPEPTPEPTPTPHPAPSGNLRPVLKCTGAKSLKLSWTKMKNVDGYDVFMTRCFTENYKLVKSLSAKKDSCRIDGLKKGVAYKMYIKPYVLQSDGTKKYASKSMVVHSYTNNGNGKKTNPKDIRLKTKEITVSVGGKADISAKLIGEVSGLPVLDHFGAFKYESGDEKIATVSEEGKVTGKAEGTCKIRVIACNGISRTVTVTVKAKLTGISFPKKEYSLKKGKTLDLAAKLKRTPAGATAKFTWESSDETVATVDKNGFVTALKKGTATITVTTKSGLGAKVKIKVKNK